MVQRLRFRWLHAACVLGLSLTTGAALADEVTLQDGSKIVGQVQTYSSEEVVIQTGFAGELRLPQSQISGISSTEPVIITLGSGEHVEGTLNYSADTGHVLTGTSAGDVPIDLADIVVIVPASDENLASTGLADPSSPQSASAAERLAAMRETHEESLRSAPADWSAQLHIGINGETGNSEAFSFFGGFNATRTAHRDRLYLDAFGRVAERNGEQTSNEIQAGARWELDLTDRVFGYLRGRAEHDRIEDIKYRLTGTGGLGVFVIREEDTEWKVRGGLGYEHERFGDDSTDDRIIGELGYDFRKAIAPWLNFTNAFTYYPSLENSRYYRMEMDTAGEIPLTNDKDWKLRLGMRNTYNSVTQPGVERLDTFYYASVVLDLK